MGKSNFFGTCKQVCECVQINTHMSNATYRTGGCKSNLARALDWDSRGYMPYLLQAILQVPVVSEGDDELHSPLASISNQAVQALERSFIVDTYNIIKTSAEFAALMCGYGWSLTWNANSMHAHYWPLVSVRPCCFAVSAAGCALCPMCLII